jgi:hypothetical protein
MEDREDDVGMDDGGTIQVEGTGSSSAPGKQTNRSGSPTPPKILYKSTTGKGVAFTSEDVQYLLDYMEYRTYVSIHWIRLQFYSLCFIQCEIGGTSRHGRILE